MSQRLGGPQLRPMQGLHGLPTRYVFEAVAVRMQAWLGRPSVQPRPQPVHHIEPLSERGHMLQRQVSVSRLMRAYI